MELDTCYAFIDSETLWAFPELSCTDGSNFSDFGTTLRVIYKKYNGKLVAFQKDVALYSELPVGSISYLYRKSDDYQFDVNFLILPVTLFILAFFAVIYKWFFRLRG